MATRRKVKNDHLIPADRTASSKKAGIWFAETDRFKYTQKKIMEAIKDNIDWVDLPGAILAINVEPPGVVVIAPNPTLPGIIVLADGATNSTEIELQQSYTKAVAAIVESMGIDVYYDQPLEEDSSLEESNESDVLIEV
jgi:hypothetical protein